MIDQTLRGNEASLPSSASTLLARDTIQLVTSLQFQARTSNKILQQAHLISFNVSSSPQSPTTWVLGSKSTKYPSVQAHIPSLSSRLERWKHHKSWLCRCKILDGLCSGAQTLQALSATGTWSHRTPQGIFPGCEPLRCDPKLERKNLKSSNSSKHIVCDDKSAELWRCPWKCWWHYNGNLTQCTCMCNDFFDILSMRHVF